MLGEQMITNKMILKEYLELDRLALGRTRKMPKISDLIWRFEISLRKCEYYRNCSRSIYGKFMYQFWRIMKHHLAIKTGFTIPLNTCGGGLALAHIGPIIISEYAKVGFNCRIHVGVNIGADARNPYLAPSIGNYVYIGPGAKLFGDIVIADEVAIGANSVVNRSFEDVGVSIAGVPAKIVNTKGIKGILQKQYTEM